jgi:hypothetical protein
MVRAYAHDPGVWPSKDMMVRASRTSTLRASCRIARTAILASSPSFLPCRAISPRCSPLIGGTLTLTVFGFRAQALRRASVSARTTAGTSALSNGVTRRRSPCCLMQDRGGTALAIDTHRVDETDADGAGSDARQLPGEVTNGLSRGAGGRGGEGEQTQRRHRRPDEADAAPARQVPAPGPEVGARRPADE